MNTLGLTGGVKVIFEHANLLSDKGYEVNLVHILNVNSGFISLLKALIKKIKYIIPKYKYPDWFQLHQDIKITRSLNINKLALSENDIIIATANETADFVNKLQHPQKNKFYFIQDYELWTREKEKVDKTYTYNLKQITTTKELSSFISCKFNKKVPAVVPCGVNEIFLTKEDKNNKAKPIILMMYHPLEKKGFKIGLEAINIIKKKLDIQFIAFGAYTNPQINLIDNYYYKPSPEVLSSLYKKADVFLYPALEEAFGICLLEASASSCLVLSTRVGWAKEYGINGENIIYIPKNDAEKISEIIQDVLINKENYQNVKKSAHLLAKQFSWQKNNDLFEKALNS